MVSHSFLENYKRGATKYKSKNIHLVSTYLTLLLEFTLKKILN